MFRNGATEEPKQCHVAERGAVFKKKVENSARVEPKWCLREAKTVSLLEKRSCFQAICIPFRIHNQVVAKEKKHYYPSYQKYESVIYLAKGAYYLFYD